MKQVFQKMVRGRTLKAGVTMTLSHDFPQDFQECARFHGHVCPGLAIGYSAAKAAKQALEIGRSSDEEVVAVVENDSCAVDAIQVLLGCTFGKGNLIFRDWGKQVFTIFERHSGRAVRVSFTGGLPAWEERHALRQKIASGEATADEKRKLDELTNKVINELIHGNPERFFLVKEIRNEPPPTASIVETGVCDVCGELTMKTRMVIRGDRSLCKQCAEN